MFSKTATFAFGLLASVPFADALGSAIIKNKCASPVYLWTVSNVPSGMKTIAAGDDYSETYQYNSDGGGVSMKLSQTPDDAGAITQLEYTLDGMLWYDISNINGYPFKNDGLTLIPSENSCRTVQCLPGVESCTDAYNTPTENYATAACGLGADMTLILCSGAKNHAHAEAGAAQDVNSAAAGIKEAAPAPAPAPTPAKEHHHEHHHKQPAGPVVTTLVTQVVTVAAPAPSEKVKRAPHRHHFHHHGA